MHPAYSVIVFTVASGAGFGLLALLGLAPLFGLGTDRELSGALGWSGFVLAFLLAAGGLAASTRHLGHPERAWRAFTQWRTSWLSREGVLAVAALGAGGLYASAALLFGVASPLLGLATAVLAVATVYATAMIYAQLKTVRRWNTPLTPACYLAFALAGGLVLLAALRALFAAMSGPDIVVTLSAAALTLAWALKLRWWTAGDEAPARSTPETATGLGALGRVRLLEAPHTSENYLLTEMGFQIARKHALKLRRIAFALGGFAPILLTLLAAAGFGAALMLTLAALSHLAGMLVERWLFFAEAEHAMMTYYARREPPGAVSAGEA
ncbi:MAG: DmsC/YnfH family molybdoenzyme membrane anchor subunit [Pseudomonadota bacterium]